MRVLKNTNDRLCVIVIEVILFHSKFRNRTVKHADNIENNMNLSNPVRLVDDINFTVLFKYEVECEGMWLLPLYHATSVSSSIIVATTQVRL